MGFMSELIDSINKILKISEPMTLPIAMSLFFLSAATIEVINSGKEVPAAMMVNPIIFD